MKPIIYQKDTLMRAKTINEYQNFERGKDPKRSMGIGVYYREWRKRYKDKPILTYYFYLIDSIDNDKFLYWVDLYYSDQFEGNNYDVLAFCNEELVDGWERNKKYLPLTLMGNKPDNFGEEVTMSDLDAESMQIFNKDIIDKLGSVEDAEMMVSELSNSWFDQDFVMMMDNWFKSGRMRLQNTKIELH